MKKALIVMFALALTGAAYAQQVELAIGNGHAHPSNKAGGGSTGGNLSYHTGGTVIRNANVVLIFWGPKFASGGADMRRRSRVSAISLERPVSTTPSRSTTVKIRFRDTATSPPAAS